MPIARYHEALSLREGGKVYVPAAEVCDIQAFAGIWNRNVKHQGFLAAARTGGGR